MPNPIDELIELPGLISSGTARSLRERAGLTTVAVGRQLDVSPATISKWELGLRLPQGANARKYARLLSRLAARDAVAS
jgi:DNA-binding transcriptional regulator YiaG